MTTETTLTVTEDALFPFGKYKGQPLAVVLADKSYTDWLAAQAWAAERYPNIVDYMRNGPSKTELSQTPEHNKLQLLFLREDMRACLWNTLVRGDEERSAPSVVFESHGWDVVLAWYLFVEIKPTVSDDFPAVLRQITTRRNAQRQRGYAVCVAKEINASSASVADIKKMFSASNVHLVTFDEILAWGLL